MERQDCDESYKFFGKVKVSCSSEDDSEQMKDQTGGSSRVLETFLESFGSLCVGSGGICQSRSNVASPPAEHRRTIRSRRQQQQDVYQVQTLTPITCPRPTHGKIGNSRGLGCETVFVRRSKGSGEGMVADKRRFFRPVSEDESSSIAY